MISLRKALLVIWFAACLYPLSADGIGVNYLFALFPIGSLLLTGRLKNPGSLLLLIMGIFVFVFFCASFYQLDLVSESGRRLISFLIFMAIFALTFVTLDAQTIAAFKLGAIVISVYFSLESILVLLAAGPANVGYAAKDLVGSQRFGFIYLFAFWLAYMDPDMKRSLGRLRLVILLALLGGLLLTFSRASIVAILLSFALFGLSRTGHWFRHLSLRGALSAVATLGGAGVLVLLLYQVFPQAFDFFGEHLFGFLSDSDSVEAHLLDQNSSEGTRVLLIQDILDFISRNPVTGAGFLGVWVLPNSPTGSAHNQYLDVLFRTGVLGLIAYATLLGFVLRHLARSQRAMYWGLVGVLIYGLFHETFKESQGACLLAFLVGTYAQGLRDSAARARESSHSVDSLYETSA